jgi:glycosyltransferase involved in cell wall biosynthesis
MKIGIEVQRLFRKKKFGIEVSSLELIRKMRDLEPHHQYVVFAKNDEDRSCLTPSDNLKVKIVNGVLFADFEQVNLPLAAAHERVDLLHCTGNTAPYFSPVPIVQTLHDVIFMDAIPGNDSLYQRFGNRYRRKVVPIVTPKSKAIITVSEFEKQRILERLSIDPALIHVIYNGINEERFHRIEDPAIRELTQKKYGLPQAYILFLGNQSARKNPDRVIEAYVHYCRRSQNPMALVTPGLTEKFIVDKLRQLSYPYSKEQFITPGYISDADLPVVYGLSKIFLFPSISEGFGMPVVEAMACGTPVVTSATSSLPEIAGDAAILINPLEPHAISDALLSLSLKEDLRRRKVADGLANARRFSWNRCAEKVLSLYEAVYLQTGARTKSAWAFERS